MKRNLFKKLLSFTLVSALVMGSLSVSNMTVKAATLEELETMVADAEYNLALNKTTALYPGCGEGNQANLNNGALGAGGAHCALSKTGWGWADESYATIDLGDYYDASSLDQVLIQYKDAADNDTVVGRSYKIQYSADGVSYYDAIAEKSVFKTDEAAEGDLTLDENRCTLDDVSAVTGTVRYVRAYYPTTATYGIQITEIAVFAENPVTVEVEKCEDAAAVSVEATAYNTIKYNITAGENQEEYVYMVYLDGVDLIGDKVSAGTDYEVTGIETGEHTLKVVSYYDGKVSEGIVSDVVNVTDVSSLLTDKKNIANINNNPNAQITSVSNLYIDDNNTYTLETSQVALDGKYTSGEGAGVALRTEAGVAGVTAVIDLGEYYRAVEFDKVLMAYSNPRTYVGTVLVEFSENGEIYTEVGSNTGFICTKDNAGVAEVNAFELDKTKLNDYVDAVRYVRLTFSDGANGWGYVINEIGIVMNTETPTTGLQPKLNDITVDTAVANTVNVSVAATQGFDDAVYTAELVDAEGTTVGEAVALTLTEGNYVGTIANVAKGTYGLKITVNYAAGAKTIDKTVADVVVNNPQIATVGAEAVAEHEIDISWTTTGYYAGQLYNIYLDGELYAEKIECEQGSETYSITNVPAGAHSVSVSIVIGEDESELVSTDTVYASPAAISTVTTTLENGNGVKVSWNHDLLEGETASYTVKLEGTTNNSIVVEPNVEGVYEYLFENLPMGTYNVTITADVNGVTVESSAEISTVFDYKVEANKVIVYYIPYENVSETVPYISLVNETGEVVVSSIDGDREYDQETGMYTFTMYVGKGTYTIKFDGEDFTAEITVEDIVAPAVLNLRTEMSNKDVTLKWDVMPAISVAEGPSTYTVYVNKAIVAEGLTDTKYTLTNVEAGSYEITIAAVYVNPYSNETYRQNASIELTIEPEPTTTEKPSTEAPTTQAPTKVTAPKSTKVISATRKKASRKIKLSIKRIKGARGYQVAVYKTAKNAKKNKKAIYKKFVRKANTRITIKSKYRKSKTLYVKVRAYKLNGKKKVYAKKWSKAKKVRIKK